MKVFQSLGLDSQMLNLKGQRRSVASGDTIVLAEGETKFLLDFNGDER